MPDSNTETTGQASESQTQTTSVTPNTTSTSTVEAQAATTTENPQAGTSTTSEEESISLSKARELRNENAALRARAKEAEDKARQLELERMSEGDRIKAERDDLKAKFDAITETHRMKSTYYEVALAAQKLGIVDPEAAAKLADWDRLEYDADGDPTNVDAILTDLIREKPYLKANNAGSQVQPPPNAGAPANPASHTPGNSNSPVVRVPQSFEEYLQNKQTIVRALEQGTLVTE